MRNSGDLIADAEKFATELMNAGVCVTLVVGIPGVRHQRYWTNLSRFGKPGLEEFSRQIEELKRKVETRVNLTQ